MPYATCESACVDDFASVQDALDYVGEKGGTLIFPPGEPTTLKNIHILGYGAEISTTDAVSGFRVSEAFNVPAQIVIEGLKVNHRGNDLAEAGFELVHAVNVTFRNCVVEAHGVGESYAAFWLHQSDPADDATGCFWNALENCTVRKRGSEEGDLPAGVKVQGAGNGSRIVGGFYHNCVNGIHFLPESGQTDMSVGFVIDGANFETDTTAILVAQTASPAMVGLRVVNCRSEDLTTFLSLTGGTTQPAVPTYLAGNYLVPGITTYLNNPTNLYVNSFDASANLALGMQMAMTGKMRMRNVSGADSTLEVWASATDQPILDMRDSAGNVIALMKWVSGLIVQLSGSSASTLALASVRSISATATRANNLRGTATFAAGTTVAVSFGTAEPDASYTVQLTPKADPVGRLWTSGLGTGGFTINNSSSTSISVDWLLVR